MIFEVLGRIMPKSKYDLPLKFEEKLYFTNKIITLSSFLVFSLIIWNALDNIDKIGTITNVIYYENAY